MFTANLKKIKIDSVLEWTATLITIIGAVFTAVNVYPAGPVLLNLGAFLWLIVSVMWKKWSLIVINATLLLIYTFGLLFKLLGYIGQ